VESNPGKSVKGTSPGDTIVDAAKCRKPYTKPEIKNFGSMSDLTQIGSGNAPEDLYINDGPSQ